MTPEAPWSIQMAVKILVNQTSLLLLKAPGGAGVRVERKKILPDYM